MDLTQRVVEVQQTRIVRPLVSVADMQQKRFVFRGKLDAVSLFKLLDRL